MQFFIQRSPLRDLYEKVAAGQRISDSDALRLFESRDLNALGAIADLVRCRKVGERATYIVNRYINYSNYCILSCQFCAFARKKRDKDGFELTVEQIVEKAREALRVPAVFTLREVAARAAQIAIGRAPPSLRTAPLWAQAFAEGQAMP